VEVAELNMEPVEAEEDMLRYADDEMDGESRVNIGGGDYGESGEQILNRLKSGALTAYH